MSANENECNLQLYIIIIYKLTFLDVRDVSKHTMWIYRSTLPN